MANTVNSPYYQLSLNILKALGGDVSVAYPDADAIWDEIYKIYDHAGGRFDIVPLEKKLTANGNYTYYPDNDADAFMPVSLVIDVPQKYTDEDVVMREDIAREEGYEIGYSRGQLEGREEGYEDGYSGGMTAQKEKLTTIEIKSNGTYSREDGYSEVTVSVSGGMSDNELQEMLQDARDEGFAEGELAQKALLEAVVFKDNGVYTRADGWNEVSVQVDQGPSDEELQEMLKDAMDEGYQDGYADGVDDGMEEGYQDGLELGYQNGFDNGVLEQKKALTSITINNNGTYTREDGYNEVIVEIETPTFVTESLNVELKENNTYTYTPTVDGYNKVNIKVDVPTSGGGDSGKPKIYNGFRLHPLGAENTSLSKVDFSQYDWSDVYDLSYFFAGFYSVNRLWSQHDFTNFIENFNGKLLACANMFDVYTGGKPPIHTLPDFGKQITNGCLSLDSLCYGQTNLYSAANLSGWDLSNVTTLADAFSGCTNLQNIPALDIPNAVNIRSIYNNCKQITNATFLDNHNVVTMSNVFYNCNALTDVTMTGTTTPADCGSMFYGCSKLINFTADGTIRVSRAYEMFRGCEALKVIPTLDTQYCKDFGRMFYGATSIETLSELDMSSCTSVSNMFDMVTYKHTLKNVGGFVNLGMRRSVSGTTNMFNYCPNLTRDSMLNIVNKLYDRASYKLSTLTLGFDKACADLLTDDEKAIAINKGWTLSFS